MFLLHVPPRARALSSRIRTAGPLVYQGLLKPLPENTAIWLEISTAIQKLKSLTSDDRRMLHKYAAAELQGRLEEPTLEAHRLLASRARGIVIAQRNAYRRQHPWRHHQAAA